MNSSAAQPSSGSDSAHDSQFATTHWSVVLSAGRRQTAEGQAALAALCNTYWYPLYAYVRRRGYNTADAQDLTQGFFTLLLEKDWLHDADQSRGRFRAFLLTALKRFLTKQKQRSAAQKRGGATPQLSLDYESGEKRYQIEPSHLATPERIYQRRWALTVLDNALAALRSEYASRGKENLFDGLKPFLTGETGAPSYLSAGEHLGMKEGAVKVAVHRLRRKYREFIRKEIEPTVSSADEIEQELQSLLESLRGAAGG